MIKRVRVTVEGKTYEATVEIIGEPQAAFGLTSPGPAVIAQSMPVTLSPAAGKPAPAAEAPAGAVPSPLSGKVVAVVASVGQEVKEGDQLVTVEAMKMNTYVVSPKAGKVAEILVKPGDQVEEGQGLVVVD